MNASVSPWLILLVVAVYGLVHSLLASLWVKAQARHWFGRLADRTYRLAYNVFAVLSFLPVLYLTWILPDQPLYSIPSPWLALSLSLQAFAGLALAISLLQTGFGSFLGLRQLVVPDRGGESRLVVKGLYRWVRHPLYTAGLLFIWLTPVMTVNLLAFNVGLSGYIVAGALLEERKLRHEYGGAYVEYQKRTPMLIPTLRRR